MQTGGADRYEVSPTKRESSPALEKLDPLQDYKENVFVLL